ncbi:MAG: hypothetical protein LUD47_00240 [Clostridia bacterium]|nr:hypothetical protein [Clostridia bacterium]
MTKRLHLKSSRLLTFAAVYGNKDGISDEHMSYGGIIEDLGFSRTSFYRAREWLVQNGLIRYDNGPAGTTIRVTDSALALIESDEPETSPAKKQEPTARHNVEKTTSPKPPASEKRSPEDLSVVKPTATTPVATPATAPTARLEPVPEHKAETKRSPLEKPVTPRPAIPKNNTLENKPEVRPIAAPVVRSEPSPEHKAETGRSTLEKPVTPKPTIPENNTPEVRPVATPATEQKPVLAEKSGAEPEDKLAAESQKKALQEFCEHFNVKCDLVGKTIEEFLRGKSVNVLWTRFEKSPGFLQTKPFTHFLSWIDRFYDDIEAGKYDDRMFQNQQMGIEGLTQNP